MVDYIVAKYKVNPARICMVGDRLDTDILFGTDNGLKTVSNVYLLISYAQFIYWNNNLILNIKSTAAHDY